MSPDLSIIIVNWNTRDLLENCLRSIQKSRGTFAIQTIVVDNNSADGSREMVAKIFPDVLLMNSGGNVGFARANNVALPRATSSLVLFLNPDTEVSQSGLEKMIAFMKADRTIGALGCKIRNSNGTIQQLGIQRFPSPTGELMKMLCVSARTQSRLGSFFPYHDPEKSGEVKKLFGACLLVRRDVLDQVGSFDERFFMYCEDVDLCHRITEAGWKLYYLSDAEILHLGGSASSTVPGRFAVLMMCESFSKFMRKHYGWFGALTYRCVTMLGALFRLAVLFALAPVKLVRNKGSLNTLRPSINKYIVMWQWALGLRHAVIRH
jgi:GT2 family glycosyltransferase